MSKVAMSSLPPQFDDAINMFTAKYDSTYTAEISNRMRVPEKIALDRGNSGLPVEDIKDNSFNSAQQRVSQMQVPDKITVDENKDVKPRKSLARFEADPIINTSNEYIGLSTPPRVLTMDTRPFPTVGENLEDDYVEPIVAGRSVTSTPQISHDLNGSLLIDDESVDDVTMLKKNIFKLNSRLSRLEEQNARQSRLNNVVHMLVLGYFAFKVLSWFSRVS